MRFWVGDAGESKRKFNGADLSLSQGTSSTKGIRSNSNTSPLFISNEISASSSLSQYVVDIITKYFGSWAPSKKQWNYPTRFWFSFFTWFLETTWKSTSITVDQWNMWKKNGALRIIGSPKQLKKITVFLETPWKFQDRFQWFWTNGFGWESRRF